MSIRLLFNSIFQGVMLFLVMTLGKFSVSGSLSAKGSATSSFLNCYKVALYDYNLSLNNLKEELIRNPYKDVNALDRTLDSIIRINRNLKEIGDIEESENKLTFNKKLLTESEFFKEVTAIGLCTYDLRKKSTIKEHIQKYGFFAAVNSLPIIKEFIMMIKTLDLNKAIIVLNLLIQFRIIFYFSSYFASWIILKIYSIIYEVLSALYYIHFYLCSIFSLLLDLAIGVMFGCICVCGFLIL